MAIRPSRRIRFVLPALAVVAAAALTPPLAAAAPDTPAGPHDVVAVEQRLGTLAMTNSLLVDRYDTARVELLQKQAAAAKARADARVAAANFDQARTQISETIAVEYEGGSFSATGALLSSASGQRYLDKLQALSMLTTHASQVAKQMSDAQAAAQAAVQRADTLVAQAEQRSAALAEQRTKLEGQIGKYRTLLGTLDPSARLAYQQSIAPPVSDRQLRTAKLRLALTASPGALKAVKFALAQVGKPYVWAAAGPSSYDCSGLTMAAWAQAGVQLPHSSEIQYTLGKAVPMNQLQPGDLIFFYGPSPAHVTIYAGSGLMVSAPTEGEDVSVVPLSAFSSDVVGARRVG
ncbi:MAG TPA: C40 family peptidase [Jatrophihabitantaceae bacterium]|nr:C40 family peptidase [Jatrophihabitantaceae bacterium]